MGSDNIGKEIEKLLFIALQSLKREILTNQIGHNHVLGLSTAGRFST